MGKTASKTQRLKTPLRYIYDDRIATRQAMELARRIDGCIRTGKTQDLKESDLFVALNTSAHRATLTKGSAHWLWVRRWHLIREHLVETNTGLVFSALRRMRSIEDDDAMSEAMWALGRAVDAFNPYLGWKFSTYAMNVILRGLARGFHSRVRRLKMFPVQHDPSMDRPIGDSTFETAKQNDEWSYLHETIDSNTAKLSDREQMVISKRFPFDGDGQTYEQLGAAMGISKERVRQILNIALAKLRSVLTEIEK